MSAGGPGLGMMKALQRWYYARAGFNKLGLLRDDIRFETPVVIEAVRRLPKQEYDDRMFRITRALNLSTKKDILPKEEWPTLDTDVQYLTPYIREVERENEERAEWNSK